MREAVVLAGGRGTRLWPLTETRPKPLIPLCGRALIDYIAGWLREKGFTRLIVAARYLGDQLVRHFRGKPGIETHVLDSRDTADAVRLLAPIIKGDHFLVAMGDVLCNADFDAFWRSHVERGGIATIMLREVDNPRPYGLVLVDDEGRIRLFIEKPGSLDIYVLSIAYSRRLGRIAYSNLVNAGFYMLSRDILGVLERNPSLMDWGRHVFPFLVENNAPVYAWVMGRDSYWEDVGRPSSYIEAVRALLSGIARGLRPGGREREPGVFIEGDPVIEGRLVPPVFIGRNVVVERDAIIGPYACIEEGARIKRGARIRGSVIWENTVVGANSVVEESILADNVYVGDTAVVEASVAGSGARLSSATVVRGARIRGGSEPTG